MRILNKCLTDGRLASKLAPIHSEACLRGLGGETRPLQESAQADFAMISREFIRRAFARGFLVLSLACAVCLAVPAIAQTSFPMVWSTYPAGVERGKTTVVTVYAGGSEGGGGGNVYGAYKVLFEGQGVTAEIVPPEKGWPAKDPKKPMEVPVVAEVKMRVTVAPDAALGVREFRICTPRHGISTVGLLVIGDEP